MITENSRATLESISFDASRYTFRNETERQRTWLTARGDGIIVYFLPGPPELPREARDTADLQEYYRGRIGNGRVQMVEFSLLELDGIPCIWTILKRPHQPRGMNYLGSLAIPFAEFSFILKIQCAERGITGIRETFLLAQARNEGRVKLGADGKMINGDWNPDAKQHDEWFPDHPLARLRREFANIQRSLRVAEKVKAEQLFGLPENISETRAR